MSVWDAAGRAWSVIRKIEELLEVQARTREALDKVEARLRALEDRMTYLEANQTQLITEARAAAGMAATSLAGSVVSDVVTRVTRMEMRQEEIHRRLPPPTST